MKQLSIFYFIVFIIFFSCQKSGTVYEKAPLPDFYIPYKSQLNMFYNNSTWSQTDWKIVGIILTDTGYSSTINGSKQACTYLFLSFAKFNPDNYLRQSFDFNLIPSKPGKYSLKNGIYAFDGKCYNQDSTTLISSMH